MKESDSIGLDYFYGHKEIELREGVEVTPYLHVDTPIKFLDFNIFVKRQETNFATKILFRNVPLNVPDEELVNLALCYGQPVGEVRRERLTNPKDKGKFGSNRTMDVLLNHGCAFENFYWMEGPLPSDQGRRVTVTHQNQPQQCSNCFGYSMAKYGPEMKLCPGNGNGRACKALDTERAKMGPYMRELQRLLGYKSLKAKFCRVGFNEEQMDDEDETDITFKTTYKSPIIEKDEQILTLQKEREDWRLEQENLKKELPVLQENLTKAKSKLEAMQKSVRQKSNQVKQAASITEKRLAEAISLDPNYLRDSPHLITLLAIFQERDDFTVDMENDTVKPVHADTFLKDTIKNIKELTDQKPELLSNDQCKERLGDIKNQLLDSVKQRWIKPGRRFSISSQTSSSSKRDRNEDLSVERINRQKVSVSLPPQ